MRVTLGTGTEINSEITLAGDLLQNVTGLGNLLDFDLKQFLGV